MQARIVGAPSRPARAGGRGFGGGAATTTLMPPTTKTRLVVTASKSAPPSTTTAPRPPRPPSTALPPPPPPPPPGSSTSPPSSSPPPLPRAAPPPKHLKDPIGIAASATRTLAVLDDKGAKKRGGEEDGGEDLSLDAYMRLPPSAYSALDPELIRRGGSSVVGGGAAPSCPEPPPVPSVPTALFTLAVPRASMLGIWLEPVVSVRVEGASPSKGKGGKDASASDSSSVGGSGSDRVRLVSTACDLRGSPAVERLRINEVFALRFETVLTWTPGGAISARVSTEVWAEPVGPFTVVPRRVIAGAGDALLRTLTGALLPYFLKKLGNDYERWARDPGYRREREAMAMEAEEREERERRKKEGGAGVAVAAAAAK